MTEPALPGCCFSASGNSRCDVDDQATCEKNGERVDCEWRVGDEPDLCVATTAAPGCCFSASGNARCNVGSQAACENMAEQFFDCEWRVGDDPDLCAQEPGCCWGPPTGTVTGCSETRSSGMVDNYGDPIEYTKDQCENVMYRGELVGCEWRSGADANCEPEICCFGKGEFCTEHPTSRLGFTDAQVSTKLACEDCMQLQACIDEPFVDGCCYGGATECFVGDDKDACEANAHAGCEWRDGVDSCGGCCVADWSLRDSDMDEFRANQDTCDVAGTDSRRCSYYMGLGQCGWYGADQVDGGLNICETVQDEFAGVGCCIPTMGSAPWDMMLNCNKFGKSECWTALVDEFPEWASSADGMVCFWVSNELCPAWATEVELFKGISEETEATSGENMKHLLALGLLLGAAVAMYALYALCGAKGKKSVRGATDERQPLILG